MESQRHAIAAVLQYLEEAQRDKSLDANLLQSAATALKEAYNITDAERPTHGLSLSDVYAAGVEALAGSKNEDDAGFDKFVKRLKRTTAFFDGVEEGSEEYVRRIGKARSKFDARRKEKVESPPREAKAASAEEPEPAVPAPTEEARREADELKQKGNALLKARDFDKAVECYTQCIALDGTNAVYYANRAAAKMHLKEYAAAADDCKIAVSIDETYARAHERLASAYRALGMDDLELEALQHAITLHPNHATLKRMLSEAEARSGSDSNGDGGLPSADQLADMASGMGMPNLSPEMIQQFLASPMGAQMASAMRGDNPAMAAMMQQGMQSMMNNPEAMAQAMQAMMGGRGPSGNSGGGGGN